MLHQKTLERELVFPVQGNGPFSTCAIVQILHPADFNFDAAEDELMDTIWKKLNDKFDFNTYNTAPIIFYFKDGQNTGKRVSQDAVNQTAQDAFNEWMHQSLAGKSSRRTCNIM